MNNFNHITVLLEELVDSLSLKQGSIAVDCTAGGGGHTNLMLEKCGKEGKVIAFDRDLMAITNLKTRFSSSLDEKKLMLFNSPFSDLLKVMGQLNLTGKVDGIAADIGVSSPQLDTPERGFSFMHDGPLDMRMDTNSGLSAKDVVNTFDEGELIRVLREFGEEPKAKFIAQGIVKFRQHTSIDTTKQLSEIVNQSVFYKTKSKKNPATKTFQALRIFVNDELGELEKLIDNSLEILRPGGRLAIIAFHSLEDRIVKKKFKNFADNGLSHLPRGLPFTNEQLEKLSTATAKIVKPFPLIPTEHETSLNTRSRSAKLRVIEKL